MTAEMTLPDFVGIGALKAGTSYLDQILRGHPEICMPPTVKEVQFFTAHYHRGPGWYARHFAAHRPGQRCGEISPQYIFDERAAKRLAELLPQAKIVVSLREPVSRFYSQYKHFVAETAYAGDVRTFITEHAGAVERGHYARQLRRYLDVFPREQVHVLAFEELTATPHVVLPRLFGFLGVDPAQPIPRSREAVNVSSMPRHHGLYVAGKRISTWLYEHGNSALVRQVKQSGMRRLFEAGGVDRDSFAPLPDDVRSELQIRYQAEPEELSALLGPETSGWWRPPPVPRAANG